MPAPPNTLITQRKKPPAQINQSVRDGVECLLEIASMERPVGSRELARLLGQDHSRVNRIISTLSYLGLVDQTVDRKYIAGAGLMVLAALSMRGSPLYRSAMPYLKDLCQSSGYHVALGMRWRTNVCYLFHGDIRDNPEMGIVSEGLYPAERSSIGLILLSQLNDTEIKELYDTGSNGVLCVPDMENLFERIQAAREKGFAIASNNHSLAVALGDPAVAGIALYHSEEEDEIPDNPEDIEKMAGKLQYAAAQILREMSRK